MSNSDYIRLYGTDPESIVDGPGLRYAIFTQGCSHHCPECHNPDSHSGSAGQCVSIDTIIADIENHRLIKDVTLSGGDPFEQAIMTSQLAMRLKQKGYGIWAFTGYLYEDLLNWDGTRAPSTEMTLEDGSVVPVSELMVKEVIQALLLSIDVLVDGPYIAALRSLELEWKGSSNQRVIDLAKMRAAGDMSTIILWSNKYEPPARPLSW